jgi:Mg2+ and Co2+ transporter CorA
MPRPQTYAEVVQLIEDHLDEVHRQVLRSTTDPARGLPRFKKKAEQAQDERALDTLLRVLADVHREVLTLDRLRSDSYARIDGDALVAEDTRIRRRLQGIPERAPSSLM